MTTIIDPHTGQPVQWNGLVDYNQVRGYEQLLQGAGLWDDSWVNSQDWMNMDRASQVAANDQFDASSLGALGGYQVGSSRNGYTVTDYLIDPQGNIVGQRDRYDQGDSFHSDDYAKMAAVIAAGLGTAYTMGDLALVGSAAAGGGTAGAAGATSAGAGGATAGTTAATGAGEVLGSWGGWNVDPSMLGSAMSTGGGDLNTWLQLGGALYGNYSNNKAADAANAGLESSNALQKYMYDQTRADYKPYRQAGYDALSQIQGLLSDPSAITKQADYQFGLQQGTNALNSGAASRGMTYSGAQQKALQRYGQDYAGTKLNESYNRLAGIAGIGQQATGSTTAAGSNYANNVGNALQTAGNNQAGAYVGNAQNWMNAFGQMANYNQQNQYLNLLRNGG